MVLRSLRKYTDLKFLVAYADPARGHVGIIYQATNWFYTGLCQATPLYDIGDGRVHHSRSLGYSFGSHGLAHLRQQGIQVRLVPQQGKHRYIYFIQSSWRSRVRAPILPYPQALNHMNHQRKNFVNKVNLFHRVSASNHTPVEQPKTIQSPLGPEDTVVAFFTERTAS
jgi:hypothetical protein